MPNKKTFKSEIENELFATLKGHSPADKLKRRGSLLIALSLALLTGYFVFFANPTPSVYKNYDMTYSQGEKVRDKAVKNGETVFYVLHRTGCQDCEKAEPAIIKQVNNLPKSYKARVIVYDLKKLSKNEQNKINTRFNSLLVMGNHMPTPTLIVTDGNKAHDTISQSYSDTKTSGIEQIFADWQGVK